MCSLYTPQACVLSRETLTSSEKIASDYKVYSDVSLRQLSLQRKADTKRCVNAANFASRFQNSHRVLEFELFVRSNFVTPTIIACQLNVVQRHTVYNVDKPTTLSSLHSLASLAFAGRRTPR